MSNKSILRLGYIALLISFLSGFCACSMSDEVQGEVVTVQLTKIDTVYRYGEDVVILHWATYKRRENIVTREKLDHRFKVGMYTTYLKRN